MFTPRILRSGPFCFDDIEIETGAEEWTATPEYDALVDAAWREKSNHGLWDGSTYRLLNFGAWLRGEDRVMRLGWIRYRYIATYPELHEAHARSGLPPLHHLSTSALVVTCDGHYLFGKRARNGHTDLIGGGAQANELAIASGADLRRNLLKEIREEAGIEEDAIEESAGIGVVCSGTSNVILLALAQTRLTRREAEERFRAREDKEMAELVFVREEELGEFLLQLHDYRRLIPTLMEMRIQRG